MQTQMERRRFLGISKYAEDKPCPPYSIVIDKFSDACTGCGDCVSACPEKILLISERSRLAVVDFGMGSCTFCEECVDACKEGALVKTDEAPWAMKATIGSNCLSFQKIACRACADFCEMRAIRFHLGLGGQQIPDLDSEACTGCGACLVACPNGSIEMREIKLQEEVL
ncbi:ferredoxin-type protein NapF [Pseudovibrio brasiliensis]|uniref:Ferredoxin-type protein NapF n=1 Tax=Pseudovibrio brasiliensis TaxID=1898042 RepID=A0ABX8APG8_9HYPH|nr:ferredoxin-type protein NapF [Pseudovibrio brasiliensis]